MQHHSPGHPSAWQHSSRNLPLWHSHQTACKETRDVLSSPGKAQKGREREQYIATVYLDTHFDPGPASTHSCMHCSLWTSTLHLWQMKSHGWHSQGAVIHWQTPKGSPQTAPCMSASRMALPCESTPYQRNNFLKHKVISKSAQPTVLTNAVNNHAHCGANNHLLEARSWRKAKL